MFKFSKLDIEVLSKKTNFQKDNLEKVLRLIDVLIFIENKLIFKPLILKGGTALQLAFFDFKRLSVDIDFDYDSYEKKEIIQQKRSEIKDLLIRYMQTKGFILSPQSKFPYSLDSFVFKYSNLRGNLDNIKIDINYTNRIHVLEPVEYKYSSDVFGNVKIMMLSKLELFATKINALIIRTTPRDFYDTYLIILEKLIHPNDYEFVKKMIIFYYVLSSHNKPIFETIKNFQENLEQMSFDVIKKTLTPVLNKNVQFNHFAATKIVIDFINEIMTLNEKEQEFLNLAQNSIFNLGLLFEQDIEDKLINHPRIKWIIQNKGLN